MGAFAPFPPLPSGATDYVIDHYGFRVEPGDTLRLFEESRAKRETQAERQQRQWSDFLSECGGTESAGSNAGVSSTSAYTPNDVDMRLHKLMASKKGRKRLKQMVRGGVPPELRPRVWHFLAGASTKREAHRDADYYARLLETVEAGEAKDKASEAQERRTTMSSGVRGSSMSIGVRSELLAILEQIDKDINRTFPGHPIIAAPEGQAALRRMLRAYCAGRNPHTGYCQGMNFVGAMLLLVMQNEQDAFWMFVLMIERLLPADYYTDGLVGVRVDSSVLVDLMQQRLPSLYQHLHDTGVLPMLPIVTTQWFISLFVFWLPTETLMRLWDCFFYEGLRNKNKIFFRVALTMFKMHEQEFKQMSDVQTVMEGLRQMSRLSFDADALMSELYFGKWMSHFTTSAMEKAGEVHRLEVLEEVQRLAERRAATAKALLSKSLESSRESSMTRPSKPSKEGAYLEEVESIRESINSRAEVARRMSAALADESESDGDGEAESGVDDTSSPSSSEQLAGVPAGSEWQPRAYLLKRSPAAMRGGDMLKMWAWQRRWFEIVDGTFSWYATRETAARGGDPLGRVPLSMVLTARAAADPGYFEVDLGNRVIKLSLYGVPKALRDEFVSKWIGAFVNQDVVGSATDQARSNKAKFWKVQ
mmetsp:Transcript_13752/g.34335  ORF Transcript_13752/g.34335 Transcript_13752/m.34335 type:complete len:647 (-) Transcript_13752:342-2282(-)